LSLGDSLRDGIAERVWASLNLSLDIQVIRWWISHEIAFLSCLYQDFQDFA
jgi:hypothetical protein